MDETNRVVKKIGRCFEVLGSDSELDLRPQNTADARHFYIELLESGAVALELVDANGDPSGNIIEEGIDLGNFTAKYKSCSEHDCPLQDRTVDEIAKKMSAMRAVMGEEHLKQNELDEAEDKFKRSLKFDKDNMQALVGLGKTNMEQEKVDEAMAVFKKISESNLIYAEANKHTFNDFAIYLRKKGFCELAIENYEKAILIDSDDEILYYNLGRANWENRDMQAAIQKIKEGLKIAGDKKLEFLEDLDGVSKEDDGFEEDKKHLMKSAEMASQILSSYVKGEREMLGNLFGNNVLESSEAGDGISKILSELGPCDEVVEEPLSVTEDDEVAAVDRQTLEEDDCDDLISDLTVSGLDDGPEAGEGVSDIIEEKEKPLKLVMELIELIKGHDPKDKADEKIKALNYLENINKELLGGAPSKKQIISLLEKTKDTLSKLKFLGTKAIASKALFNHFDL